jgi:hypothetical protein
VSHGTCSYIFKCIYIYIFDGEKLNLRKLNDPEVRKQYQIEITNRFAPWENLSDEEDKYDLGEH